MKLTEENESIVLNSWKIRQMGCAKKGEPKGKFVKLTAKYVVFKKKSLN